MVLLKEAPGVVEKLGEVNAFTDRVKRRKREYLAARPHLCPDRSRLIVESWRETEGEPSPIRWAKAFRKVLEGIPVCIRDGELVVGSLSKYTRGCYANPEVTADTFIEQLAQEKLTSTGDYVACDIEEEERQSILEDARYWEGKSSACQIQRAWKERWGTKIADFLESGLLPSAQTIESGRSAVGADYDKVLNRGLRVIIAEAEEDLDRLKTSKREDPSEARHFLQAVVIACEAVISYAHRHADLAREMAIKETDAARRQDLDRIAEICDRVPTNPARSFHEAIQSFWFIMLCQFLETPGFGKTPARFDQYMYPYYEQDVSGSLLSRQQAAELLGCLWVKMQEVEAFQPVRVKEGSQSSLMLNMTIGGVKEDGSDATNELSYLILDVARQVKVNTPHISLRYHDRIPEEFLIKAVETCRDHGGGIPAFFSDKVSLLNLCATWGVSLSEARQWATTGCASRRPQSATLAPGGFHGMSLAKCFELAFHNGRDPATGKQLGPTTGDARNFNSFEELYEAFKKQYAAALDIIIESMHLAYEVLGRCRQVPFESALLKDCIKNGKDCLSDGARQNSGKGTLILHGHQNPANSLVAIKKLVFEDKAITMGELMDALACNFEGKEQLRQMLMAAPKYGNDDDYADEMMKDIFAWTETIAWSHPNPWGGKYHLFREGLSLHYQTGRLISALPDGRKAGTPLADGSLSPMQGTDTKGPTALLNSASKIDIVGSGSTLLNQKLHPSLVQTRQGIKKLLTLIKTYFDRYGYMIQFNIVKPETLLDARKHPERYRDLIVRVAGYSAYFIELAPEIQDEIIARTTQIAL